MLRSLWVCEVCCWNICRIKYFWQTFIQIRVKRFFGFNTHGRLFGVELIVADPKRKTFLTKLTFIFGGVLKICNVLMQVCNDQASGTFMYMITNSSGDKYKRLSSPLKLECCSLNLGSQSPLYSWRNELFFAFQIRLSLLICRRLCHSLMIRNSLTTAIIQPLKNHVRFKKDFKAR